MRLGSQVWLCVALAVAVLTLATSRQALSAEPALPRDGIDDPLPGPLALPARLEGPNRSELARSVSVDFDNRRAADGLILITTYGESAPGSEIAPSENVLWNVKIQAFERKGAAHEELHSRLVPAASGPIAPWHERWQRVVEAPGLLLRQVHATGCDYSGVLRQCYIEVHATIRKDVPPEGRPAVVERAVSAGRDLALRVLAAVKVAPAALRTIRSGFAERVVLDHQSLNQDRDSRLVVQLTPDAALGSAQPVRLVFVAGPKVKSVYTNAEQLRKGPAATFDVEKGTNPAGTLLRVFRILESYVLELEEIRLAVGPRGNRVVKIP